MRSRAAALVGAVAVALALSACGTSEPQTGDAAAATAAATDAAVAPASGAELNAAEFAAALAAPDTVVLDVRTAAEFASGHLPDAVNIDVQSPDFAAQLAGLDTSVPYAVYCRSGNRSQAALDVMEGAGFTQAYHLGGGIGAWQQAGGQIVTGG